jgi:predicted SAM-dependent methyltransferase
MRIDIGGADSPKQGFASVDKYYSADYKADFTNLPFPDNSIQEVYTSHTLEHLGKKEAPLALKEIYRVLQPNGIFTIIVPDLEWIAIYWYQSKDKTGFLLDAIYGNQNHEGEFHKTGFTKESLQKLVESVGLKITKSEYIWDHEVQSIIIEGVKDGKSNI